MFKLENIKNLNIISLLLVILVLNVESKELNMDKSIDGSLKYDSIKGKYGPYHLNIQDTKNYNNGRNATKKEIKIWNIDIKPDGKDLPLHDMKDGEIVFDKNGKAKIAKGSVEWGEELYDAQCVMCHGEFGVGGKGYPTLAGGEQKDLSIQRLNPADDNPNPDSPLKTIGSYWPYASTLYWYIQDSMPFTNPKTLTNSETYALTAFLLYSNGIELDGDELDDEFILSKDNFDRIKLANEDGFYPNVDTKDPQVGIENIRRLLSDPSIYGTGNICMNDCIKEDVKNLIMRIKVDLVPNIDQTLSSERSRKETQKSTLNGEDPLVIENYEIYCSVCHSNKAIGAPVIGDKDAWLEVLEKGIGEVYQNGINGINAMPPMGTSSLPEDEFKAIIDYIISKSK